MRRVWFKKEMREAVLTGRKTVTTRDHPLPLTEVQAVSGSRYNANPFAILDIYMRYPITTERVIEFFYQEEGFNSPEEMREYCRKNRLLQNNFGYFHKFNVKKNLSAKGLEVDKMPLCVDLCSGYGCFSQPFLDAGWEVIRFDNNIKFRNVPNTIIEDVRNFTDIQTKLSEKKITLIVASPPCERFSIANRMFPKRGVYEGLQIVRAVYELIARLHPQYWVVENPRGRLRWFLGKGNSTISLSNYGGKYKKPTDLWHNFALPLVKGERPYEPSWSSVKNKGKGSTGLLRLRDPAKRAKLPYGLGQTILEIIEKQEGND